MANEERPSGQSTPVHSAEHLCVFVHGLWGNPQHLSYLSNSLKQKYGEDQLKILVCKRNASSFTYDGIEVGGERVAKEIEETLEELSKDGDKIKKFSIVGYSLGGLIARYAIGLLYHKGIFDHIEPVNFTTFATPHLGVRTPLTGYANYLFNYLGSRTLSASGSQMFLVDKFRTTDRPLLSVLADPDSIFIHALKSFKNRSLYANIVNDRSVVYYTSSISKNNPYQDLDKLQLHYAEGYEPVILNSEDPFEIAPSHILPSFSQRLLTSSQNIIQRSPRFLAFAFFIPLGVAIFLVNSTVQTFRSRRRITLHESDDQGHEFHGYRVSWMVQDVRAGMETAFEAANATQRPDYLPSGAEEMSEDDGGDSQISTDPVEKEVRAKRRRASSSFERVPTLALTAGQFAMIKALDDVGFRKHRVHIQKSTHSHAALIVRHRRAAFDEGKVVVKHWLDTEFEL